MKRFTAMQQVFSHAYGRGFPELLWNPPPLTQSCKPFLTQGPLDPKEISRARYMRIILDSDFICIIKPGKWTRKVNKLRAQAGLSPLHQN